MSHTGDKGLGNKNSGVNRGMPDLTGFRFTPGTDSADNTSTDDTAAADNKTADAAEDPKGIKAKIKARLAKIYKNHDKRFSKGWFAKWATVLLALCAAWYFVISPMMSTGKTADAGSGKTHAGPVAPGGRNGATPSATGTDDKTLVFNVSSEKFQIRLAADGHTAAGITMDAKTAEDLLVEIGTGNGTDTGSQSCASMSCTLNPGIDLCKAWILGAGNVDDNAGGLEHVERKWEVGDLDNLVTCS